MTDDERKVVKAIKRLSKLYRRADKKLSNAREALGDNCNHPKKYVKSYFWEHDNGYGRQTNIEGLHCTLCLKEKHRKTMGSWR